MSTWGRIFKIFLPPILVSVSCVLRSFGTRPAVFNRNPKFDLVIHAGHIIDGTGSPWYSADIAVRDGRIAAIGVLDPIDAKRVIDAKGKIVAPGFIDMLGQSGLSILAVPSAPSKVFQGITTEITGEGDSVAPLNDDIIAADAANYARFHITPDWHDFEGYFKRLERERIGLNLAIESLF